MGRLRAYPFCVFGGVRVLDVRPTNLWARVEGPHDGVTCEDAIRLSAKLAPGRATKVLRELRNLGYRVELTPAPSGDAS
jgi:hypothetical protein